MYINIAFKHSLNTFRKWNLHLKKHFLARTSTVTLKSWLNVALYKIPGPRVAQSICNIYDSWFLIICQCTMHNANRWCNLLDWIFKWQAIGSCNVNDYKTRMILQNVQKNFVFYDFSIGWLVVVVHLSFYILDNE